MPTPSNLQFFFFLAEKGNLMQENVWFSNQEKGARILLIIMLAILDQMRTSFLAWMRCNCIPTCVIFRVLFLTLYNELCLEAMLLTVWELAYMANRGFGFVQLVVLFLNHSCYYFLLDSVCLWAWKS